MIRYILSVLAMLLFAILNLIVAPILPAFRVSRLGPVDNNNDLRVEPRLPDWLAWFDTSDNSLYGDGGWRTEHCPYYASYFGMVRWLWRNGGHNFNYDVLGCDTGVVTQVTPYFAHNERGFWLFRRFYRLWEGRYLEVFLGWNLGDGRCKITCQLRGRTSTN